MSIGEITKNILYTLPFVLLFQALYYMVLKRSKVYFTKQHIIGGLLFAIVITGMLTVTGITPLNGFSFSIRLEKINLKPFWGIADLISVSQENKDGGIAFINIVGNLLLFLPFGCLLPLLWSQYRKLWKTALFGAIFSFTIEFLQLFLNRGADIDDLILNTLGAVLGYGCYRLGREYLPILCEHFCMKRCEQQKESIVMRQEALTYIVIACFCMVGVGYIQLLRF